MKKYILEACVDSVESALMAIEGGASRLELCSNLIIGGTTPSLELFKAIRRHSHIRIHVLIRPRFGDFYYSDHEFEIIKNEVIAFRELGAEGVVIGLLKQDGTLDQQRMKELIALAQGMSITLHRAFDVCQNPYEALEEAVNLGIHTILTSGQHNNCTLGRDILRELVRQSAGRIDILVAGGVEAKVIGEMHPYTKATSYHMSGKIEKDSCMQYRKENVNMGIDSLSEYIIWETSKEKIEDAKGVLEKLCFQTNVE
ncbi:MAG: copper homeostasis protein CutC [Cellulosilyticaceae bacterium]